MTDVMFFEERKKKDYRKLARPRNNIEREEKNFGKAKITNDGDQ